MTGLIADVLDIAMLLLLLLLIKVLFDWRIVNFGLAEANVPERN